ncbi:MAG: HD domain-containing phosphohydrolase, partial [Thermoleophilaceae bacterium]
DHAGAVLDNGRLHGEMRDTYISIVRMLAEAIEAKDPSTRLHSEEVAGYVSAVADRLDIESERREELVVASLLHDVGKIGISERILLKPGPLTPEERDAIEMHPRIGFHLVQQVPALEGIGQAVLHHHERYDGEGYPSGLAGEEIPLEARVVCVADSFSAMTSTRPYRQPLATEEALTEIERCAGTHFDPRVVALFVDEVRRRPPDARPAVGDGLDAMLEDPEIRARRDGSEPVLGYGPVGAVDNLTLLYSFRHMHEATAAAAENAAVTHNPFAVVLLELTALAEINGREGFAAGDHVITEAARAMSHAAARARGTACRYGGRRLALLVPDYALEPAAALGRDLEIDLQMAAGTTRTSAAVWQPGDSGDSVIERARMGLALSEIQAQEPRAPEPLAPEPSNGLAPEARTPDTPGAGV